MSSSNAKAASTNVTFGTADASGDLPPAGDQSGLFSAVREARERFRTGDKIAHDEL
jgi:hypothetical protein